jgi:protoporphyrinogen oxidase
LDLAILGGGISGLASARRLAQRGHRITLYEADDRLGGLAGTFAHDGIELEKFYHCMLPADAALLAHVAELGLAQSLVWSPTGMGFRVGESTYPLNTPLDLLRFAPLGWMDRVRLGLLAVFARLAGTRHQLDDVTAADFVRRVVGPRAFDLIWKPLLAAKIGDHYPALPALWLTTRMHREKNVSREEKGCLVGGYRALTEAFAHALTAGGASIHTKCEVARLALEGGGVRVGLADGRVARHDAVLSTLPLPAFQRLAAGCPLPREVADLALDYQGVVSGVFLTDRPLTPHYWAPWVDCGTTSQGLIAMSRVVPLERTRGLHVHYLVNYTHRDSALFRASDAEMIERYESDLTRVHPEARGAIVGRHVFRAPFVEPMWTTGYAKRKPPHVLVPGRLYLASTAQLYPRVNSWNACCEMVDDMAAEVGADLARTRR